MFTLGLAYINAKFKGAKYEFMFIPVICFDIFVFMLINDIVEKVFK